MAERRRGVATEHAGGIPALEAFSAAAAALAARPLEVAFGEAVEHLRAVGVTGGAVHRRADGGFQRVVLAPGSRLPEASPPVLAEAAAEGVARDGGLVYLGLLHGDELLGVAELEAATGLDGASTRMLGSLLALALAQHAPGRIERQLVESGKVTALGELASGVAHEINNPLFAILGLVEFLLLDAVPGTKEHERLLLIQESGNEIKEIVKALLDFNRERTDEFGPVTLARVAAETLELVLRTSLAKDVEVEVRVAEDVEVEGSPNLLKQVLLNLVANAQQAMPNGGSIVVEVGRDGAGRPCVSVLDDGPGIPAEVLPRIFEPFFTTRRGSGGTGLGLAVALGIARMHDGELTVASERGRGTRFVLALPSPGGPG